MTIKSMAAGRCSPYVGLTFSWNAIRERDMVTVGAFSPQEVEEDVGISLAAIEHRFPPTWRSAPAPTRTRRRLVKKKRKKKPRAFLGFFFYASFF